MSTNSTIQIKNPDGTIQGIYCHWDGYPSNNGKLLLEHYTDPDKIKKLIQGGNISSLAPEIDPKDKHSFDTPEEGVVVFYHRDRGEALEGWSNYGNQEYNYQFRDGRWYMSKGDGNFRLLTPKMCEE